MSDKQTAGFVERRVMDNRRAGTKSPDYKGDERREGTRRWYESLKAKQIPGTK